LPGTLIAPGNPRLPLDAGDELRSGAEDVGERREAGGQKHDEFLAVCDRVLQQLGNPFVAGRRRCRYGGPIRVAELGTAKDTQPSRYGQGNGFQPRDCDSASGISGRPMNCCSRLAASMPGCGTQSALAMRMPLRSTFGIATSTMVATKSSIGVVDERDRKFSVVRGWRPAC
jgi:hypothetical protein